MIQGNGLQQYATGGSLTPTFSSALSPTSIDFELHQLSVSQYTRVVQRDDHTVQNMAVSRPTGLVAALS